MIIINKIISAAKVFFEKKAGIQKFIPAIIWFFILLILLMLPGKNLPETNEWLNKIFFDKWIHAGLFGMLALLFIAPVMSAPQTFHSTWAITLIIVIAISLWGLTTEFLQHAFVSGRSFDIYDWMADTVGALLAVWVSKQYFLNKSPR